MLINQIFRQHFVFKTSNELTCPSLLYFTLSVFCASLPGMPISLGIWARGCPKLGDAQITVTAAPLYQTWIRYPSLPPPPPPPVLVPSLVTGDTPVTFQSSRNTVVVLLESIKAQYDLHRAKVCKGLGTVFSGETRSQAPEEHGRKKPQQRRIRQAKAKGYSRRCMDWLFTNLLNARDHKTHK